MFIQNIFCWLPTKWQVLFWTLGIHQLNKTYKRLCPNVWLWLQTLKLINSVIVNYHTCIDCLKDFCDLDNVSIFAILLDYFKSLFRGKRRQTIEVYLKQRRLLVWNIDPVCSVLMVIVSHKLVWTKFLSHFCLLCANIVSNISLLLCQEFCFHFCLIVSVFSRRHT